MLLLIIPIQIYNSNGIYEITNWHPVNHMSYPFCGYRGQRPLQTVISACHSQTTRHNILVRNHCVMGQGKIMLVEIKAIYISKSNDFEEIPKSHPVNRMGSLLLLIVVEGRSRLLQARGIPRQPVIISLCEIIVLWDKVK